MTAKLPKELEYNAKRSDEENHKVLQIQLDYLKAAIESVNGALLRMTELIARMDEKIQQNKLDVAGLMIKSGVIAGSIPVVLMVAWKFAEKVI